MNAHSLSISAIFLFAVIVQISWLSPATAIDLNDQIRDLKARIEQRNLIPDRSRATGRSKKAFEEFLEDTKSTFRKAIEIDPKAFQPWTRQIRPKPSVDPNKSPAETKQARLSPVFPPQRVPIEAYPWNVGLIAELGSGTTSAEQGYFCGGVAVASRWVLTAAHCTENISGKTKTSIISGTASLKKKISRQFVDKTVLHPGYVPGLFENDIALLKTATPMAASPIALPQRQLTSINDVGAVGQVVGWGITKLAVTADFGEPGFVHPALSTELVLIGMQIVSRDSCNGPAGHGGRVARKMFCARSLLNGYDACQGFGGSPLIQNDRKGKRYLAGIASWGEGCALPDKPGIYTDVSQYLGWINDTINQ